MPRFALMSITQAFAPSLVVPPDPPTSLRRTSHSESAAEHGSGAGAADSGADSPHKPLVQQSDAMNGHSSDAHTAAHGHGGGGDTDSTAGLDPALDVHRTRRRVYHIALTCALLAMNLIVAIFVSNLGAVFGFIGAVSGCSISLIMPTLCYLKLVSDAPLHKRVLCVIVAVAGIAGAISCVVQLVILYTGNPVDPSG
jgi:hypothetical protein